MSEEPEKLTFFQRMKVRFFLRKLRKLLEKTRVVMVKTANFSKKITDEEQKKIDNLKIMMIESIMGDPKTNRLGFIHIFEIYDGNKLVTRESLEKMDMEELLKLSEDLTNNLAKEI